VGTLPPIADATHLPRETVAERLRAALDLADLAERMLRQRRRREGLGEAETERRIEEWYAHHRPGAPDGDTIGRVRPWPPAPR